MSRSSLLLVGSSAVLALAIYIGIRSQPAETSSAAEPASSTPAAARVEGSDPSPPKTTEMFPSPPEQEGDWKVHRNEEFGYEISYPEEATLKTRGSNRILIDIGGEAIAFSVRVLQNPEELSGEGWVEELKARASRGEDAPVPVEQIFPDRGSDEGPVNVDTLSGYRLRVFAGDHEKDLVFFAVGPFIYQLGFAAADPNDPDFETHSQVFHRMLESFRIRSDF